MYDVIQINQLNIGKEEIDAVVEVLKSGVLTEKGGGGPKVLEFEKNFANFVGAKHAVVVASGTAALHTSLLAAGVGLGDEVIVPSFTFAATAGAVLLTGAKPVFADIDIETYCVKPEAVQNAITEKTKAIVPVHMYGLPCDMDQLRAIANEHNILMIEDAAQAHGAEYRGMKIGTIGDMTCFSFYAGKNLATGEGGMITANDEEYAKLSRMIRTHGESRPYWISRLGHNYRMLETTAAIGIAQLKKLPKFLEQRRKNAEAFNKGLSMFTGLALPKEPEGRRHAWHLYTVRMRGANAGKRNKTVEKLRAKNIQASVYYQTPVHLLPLYRENSTPGRGTLLNTERAARQVFSLPVHPQVTPDDISYMIATLKKVLA